MSTQQLTFVNRQGKWDMHSYWFMVHIDFAEPKVSACYMARTLGYESLKEQALFSSVLPIGYGKSLCMHAMLVYQSCYSLTR